jgi:hypothetical protein
MIMMSPSSTKTRTASEEAYPSSKQNDAKRARIRAHHELPVEFITAQTLLRVTVTSPLSDIPRSLIEGGKVGNNIEKLRELIDRHELRTSVIQSPRQALSIYKDSCVVADELCDTPQVREGKRFLVSMLGLHPDQGVIEHHYASSIRQCYCLLIFCHRLRQVCTDAFDNPDVARVVLRCEELCLSMGIQSGPTAVEEASKLSASVAQRVKNIVVLVSNANHRYRPDQLEHEYQRIVWQNSTFSNALLTRFVEVHGCVIKDVYFKRIESAPKYERITIYLYDPELDAVKPPMFTFLPSLRIAIDEGPLALVEAMVSTFWSQLLRQKYFATPAMKECLAGDLERFFLSGLTTDCNLPLRLNAHFEPSSPLSYYLYGKAGAGKSSLVRAFSPALQASIEEHVDPEILVRFVKQNLNKPQHVLDLELEARPNNNDLSVMGIIQGRRMTMTQSKPGLVVIDLEEMPSKDSEADPNQLDVAHLISQRFAGRNGAFKEEIKAPRNSEKRGIANDASLVSLFTSNYVLDESSQDALKRLKMFENLTCIEVKAVSGDERKQFANSYLEQCILDLFPGRNISCELHLAIPLGEGDTRPLVRHLRMLAFYIQRRFQDSLDQFSTTEIPLLQAWVKEEDAACHIKIGDQPSFELKLGPMGNLFPLTHRVFDTRVKAIVHSLQDSHLSLDRCNELSVILDFWLLSTLAPTVIVSKNKRILKTLVATLVSTKDVHLIPDIDASRYKMMKSLYDPKDTPNLKDDILQFGPGALVAAELNCPSADSQLCIRELIEDNPSMTAFSTPKSALYKSGLLFTVFVEGEITPHIRSRASLIM